MIRLHNNQFRQLKLFNIAIYMLLFSIPISAIWNNLNLSFFASFNSFTSYYVIAIGFFYILTSKMLIRKYYYLLLVYFIYIIITGYIHPSGEQILFIIKKQVFTLSLFFFFVLLRNADIKIKMIDFGLRLFRIIIIISPIVSILQVWDPQLLSSLSDPFLSDQDIYNTRRWSIFNIESSYGMAKTFIPIASIVIYDYLSKNHLLKVFVTLLLVGISVMLSNTRFMMIAYIILMFFVFIYARRRLNSKLVIIVIIALSGVLILNALSYFGYNYTDFYEQRLHENLDRGGRYNSLLAAITIFPKVFLWGTGSESSNIIVNSLSGDRTFIHNGWASHLVVYGVTGSSFLFMFYYYLLRDLKVIANKTNFFAAYYSYLIFILFNLFYVTVVFFSSGILLSLVYGEFFYRKFQHSKESENAKL